MRIQLIKSPTAPPYLLAYEAGQLVDFKQELAEQLIKDGYAIKAPDNVRTTKAAASEKRTGGIQSNDGTDGRATKSKRGKKLPKS